MTMTARLTDRELRRVIWACALLVGLVLILGDVLDARGWLAEVLR